MYTELRAVPGHPDYKVGDDGTVWTNKNGRWPVSGDRWRRMRPNMAGQSGYPSVVLCSEGGRERRYVHDLVLTAFVGPRPDDMEAAHEDGNPKNCRLGNLSWKIREDIEAGKKARGTDNYASGEQAGSAVLTDDKVRAIWRMKLAGMLNREIAAVFNVSTVCVTFITHKNPDKRTWKHLSPDPRKGDHDQTQDQAQGGRAAREAEEDDQACRRPREGVPGTQGDRQTAQKGPAPCRGHEGA